MSAEKPEVGDVFLNWHSQRKSIVVFQMKRRGYQCLVENGGLSVRFESELKNMKYLGKSKASVNNLFQTEQDVANNIAKPDLQHLQAENNRLRETLKSQIKALLALKGFYPETSLFADDNIRRIRQALIGESEE